MDVTILQEYLRALGFRSEPSFVAKPRIHRCEGTEETWACKSVVYYERPIEVVGIGSTHKEAYEDWARCLASMGMLRY